MSRTQKPNDGHVSGASGASAHRSFKPVDIPTNEAFLEKWHHWVHGRVSRHFKHNRDRIADTAQDVRLRLLSKDFIARWFFKHLSHELVDLPQAMRILGGTKVTFIGEIQPAAVPDLACTRRRCVRRRKKGLGCSRSCERSLWRVSDLLTWAEFDYQRYFYSAQGHTLGSDRVLELLGYPPRSYGILESLYRQGRLRPAELTEHECQGGSNCPGCVRGRARLNSKGLSLAHRWDDPRVESEVRKLRWNDSQIGPFLRNWRRKNAVAGPPAYVMRPAGDRGIDAGLLKYVQIIVDNTVVNNFKRYARAEDVTRSVLNGGMGPERSNAETLGWDSDEEGEPVAVFMDAASTDPYDLGEHRRDIGELAVRAGLNEDEIAAIAAIELMELTARQYAESSGKKLQSVRSARESAFRKLRGVKSDREAAREALRDVCSSHGLRASEVLGDGLFGRCVLARTDLFSRLLDEGLTVASISRVLSYPEERVVAAINRSVIRELRDDG